MAQGGRSDDQACTETESRAATSDERAVACASELFLGRGIAAVKMTDIADAAGVGVATLYRHFSTKAAIAAAAGTLLWERLYEDYERLVEREDYRCLNGADRLERLLSTYCERYLYQPGFAVFFDELDRLVLAGDVGEEAVAAYSQTLIAPFSLYRDAYLLGLEDGSIGREVDFALFYRSLAHALLSVAGKLQRGEVLPSDDFSAGANELGCLMDMAILSLRAQEEHERMPEGIGR